MGFMKVSVFEFERKSNKHFDFPTIKLPASTKNRL